MEEFITAVECLQRQLLVGIGSVEIVKSGSGSSVSIISTSGPLDLKIICGLAFEHHLDWHVKLSRTKGVDSKNEIAVFVAKLPADDEEDDNINGSTGAFASIAVDANETPALRTVADLIRVPSPKPKPLFVRSKRTWICIGLAGSDDHEKTVLTKEMLDLAVRHTRTVQAHLWGSSIILEIPEERVRKRANSDTLLSPPKRTKLS